MKFHQGGQAGASGWRARLENNSWWAGEVGFGWTSEVGINFWWVEACLVDEVGRAKLENNFGGRASEVGLARLDLAGRGINVWLAGWQGRVWRARLNLAGRARLELISGWAGEVDGFFVGRGQPGGRVGFFEFLVRVDLLGRPWLAGAAGWEIRIQVGNLEILA